MPKIRVKGHLLKVPGQRAEVRRRGHIRMIPYMKKKKK